MPTRAPQQPEQSINEVRFHAVSFAGKLDDGELLTGTPTITEVDTTDLVITSKAVSTTALVINGVSVPAGMAVQCKIDGSGMTARQAYRVYIQCDTDAGQTLNGEIVFRAIA